MTEEAINKIFKRIQILILLFAVVTSLAVVVTLDVVLNKQALEPTPWLWGLGVVAGFGAGVGLNLWQGRRIKALSFRISWLAWLAWLISGLTGAGLIFNLKLSVPMDWRIVIAGGCLFSLVGGIGSLWVCRRVSQDLQRYDPEPLQSSALQRLHTDLSRVRHQYPGAEGEPNITEEGTYLTWIKVPRRAEVVMFWVVCDEAYPQHPPYTVRVELLLDNGYAQEETYTGSILGYWNNNYGLQHIVQQALEELRH